MVAKRGDEDGVMPGTCEFDHEGFVRWMVDNMRKINDVGGRQASWTLRWKLLAALLDEGTPDRAMVAAIFLLAEADHSFRPMLLAQVAAMASAPLFQDGLHHFLQDSGVLPAEVDDGD